MDVSRAPDMNDRQPAVSVIIPCCNQGATLDEAVDSVLMQTFTDFEIVIVNDGSTDSFTNELLGDYHRPKTRVIPTLNQGLAEARNTAIRNSNGKYILPLDADDRIHPDYLACAVPTLELNPDALIVHCLAERFGDDTGIIELPEFSRKTMLFRNLIFCTALFRRSDYDETRGYNPNLVYAYEDWDFWLSLLELRPSGLVVKIPRPLFNYRVHPKSMLNSLTEEKRLFSRMRLFLNHVATYERYGIDPIGLYSADQELEKNCARLENQYREIRSSREYKVGSVLLKPFGTATTAMLRNKFHQLKRKRFFGNSPALKAIPNPIQVCMETGLGETTLSWSLGSAETVEIHVDAPHGPLFVRAGAPGSAVTGKWVHNGMIFYLQDVSKGLPLTPANTLATTRITGVSVGAVAPAKSLRLATKSLFTRLAPSGMILMYHRITESSPDPWQLNVTPEHFESHLQVLRGHCRLWPLQRALHALQGGNLPPRTVVVTFDDGYRDNFVRAKPILEKHDVPATLFLTSGYIDSPRGYWWDEIESAVHPILSGEEVAELDESELVEVGSHTVTHPLLTALPHAQQKEEIVRGKRELEDILGHPVTSFAYPHGQYNTAIINLVQEAGFACGCSTDAGMLTPKADRFCLPRLQAADCDGEEFAHWITDWFGRAI